MTDTLTKSKVVALWDEMTAALRVWYPDFVTHPNGRLADKADALRPELERLLARPTVPTDSDTARRVMECWREMCSWVAIDAKEHDDRGVREYAAGLQAKADALRPELEQLLARPTVPTDSDTARRVAEILDELIAALRVWYPDSVTHPNNRLADKADALRPERLLARPMVPMDSDTARRVAEILDELIADAIAHGATTDSTDLTHYHAMERRRDELERLLAELAAIRPATLEEQEMSKKAIRTKYHGLSTTDTRGAWISALDMHGNRASIPFPHGKGGEEAHALAALRLCRKMGWKGQLIGGVLDDTSYVFVFRDGNMYDADEE